MTITELIKELHRYSPDLEVKVQSHDWVGDVVTSPAAVSPACIQGEWFISIYPAHE
ncbi:hypothetical protein SEA_LOZINAK_13 [Gordonia phage Lozinak]|uniref:Uncharacterized protein n=3 Tax=Smoothievirus smoothie TaxID=1982561 RepID=A0A2D1GFT8_9CAUD|nr:HNH endonuclease [Gordonia phage Smoothie]ATN90646.1 hypothetical protein SEA_LOZINAK_13 [Gordonia phage Lozinak]AUE23581.1 hypothetical protein SEA_TONIANN_13 [Gordonia phage Toniann]QAU06885.1 hypothetical protein SEA_APHELION_13 [Gordonia phage Aphelion]QKY79598.1 hypothetical protein SEA_ENGINEER_13 [Gordonia Phage Engineer]QYC53505.1 hypothetical protein SEA_NORVS_13 [Gordonia phage Norvs]